MAFADNPRLALKSGSGKTASQAIDSPPLHTSSAWPNSPRKAILPLVPPRPVVPTAVTSKFPIFAAM